MKEIGRAVLANQFVTGLHSELKAKVPGSDGDFEQLLVKARFEEATLRDLATPPPTVKSFHHSPGDRSNQLPWGNVAETPKRRNTYPNNPGVSPRSELKCYACGAGGHMASNCPKNQRSGQEEAQGA